MIMKLHNDAVDEWSTKDSKIVLKGEHARGRQAGIRAGLINKMIFLNTDEKHELYDRYCQQLNAKIAAVDGGRSRGTMPVPKFG